MSTLMAGSREEALAVFRRHWTYLSGPNAAQSLWRKLTPTQKQQVGGSLSVALSLYGRPTRIWMHLYPQISEPKAVVELAMKLFSFPVDEGEWLLREMGELPMDDEAAQSEAISRGDLVLVRSTRTVFWNGVDLEVDWRNSHVLWEFLLLACEHTIRGEDISRLSIGDHVSERIVADRIYRLRQLDEIPDALTDYFEPVGRGTQRFTYPADRIHIFDD